MGLPGSLDLLTLEVAGGFFPPFSWPFASSVPGVTRAATVVPGCGQVHLTCAIVTHEQGTKEKANQCHEPASEPWGDTAASEETLWALNAPPPSPYRETTHTPRRTWSID